METELDIKYRDHALTGNYVGFRECHIQPDWLLIYMINHNDLIFSLHLVQLVIQIYSKAQNTIFSLKRGDSVFFCISEVIDIYYILDI